MAPILDQARALVRAIRESPEWLRMRPLAELVKADPGAERLLVEFRLKQVELQVATIQGQQPNREQQAAYQSLANQVQSHPILHGYVAAEEAFGRLLEELRLVLNEVFQPEVPGALRGLGSGAGGVPR